MIFNFDNELIEKKYIIWIKYKINGNKHKILITKSRNIFKEDVNNAYEIIIKERIYGNIFLLLRHLFYSIPINIFYILDFSSCDNIGRYFYKFKLKSNDIREVKFIRILSKKKNEEKIVVLDEYDKNIICRKRDIGRNFIIFRNIISLIFGFILLAAIEFIVYYILGELFDASF